MNRYWWVLIPVIFLAAFSGPIAAAVKTDGKLKKVILVFLQVWCSCAASQSLLPCLRNRDMLLLPKKEALQWDLTSMLEP